MMLLVHRQGVEVKGVAGVEAEAGEEVLEEGEHHNQQPTRHGLLWTVSKCLQSPCYYGHFILSQRNAHTFSYAKTPLMWPSC